MELATGLPQVTSDCNNRNHIFKSALNMSTSSPSPRRHQEKICPLCLLLFHFPFHFCWRKRCAALPRLFRIHRHPKHLASRLRCAFCSDPSCYCSSLLTFISASADRSKHSSMPSTPLEQAIFLCGCPKKINRICSATCSSASTKWWRSRTRRTAAPQPHSGYCS
jgi:hypothetical protein